jgi:hypothetical protein
VIVIGCSSTACLATSRLYWGYWIFPPSADWVVSSVVSIERFTTFSCCRPSQSGQQAVQSAAEIPFHGAGDPLDSNLPKALIRRGLKPDSAQSLPATLITKVRAALESRGALAEGEPGYVHAKELWGHVAVGRNAQGTEIVVAALNGGEASNDHYPYYEAAFAASPSGELSPLRIRRYWFDVAGLEGIAHWLGALAGGLVGTIWSAAYIIRRK